MLTCNDLLKISDRASSIVETPGDVYTTLSASEYDFLYQSLATADRRFEIDDVAVDTSAASNLRNTAGVGYEAPLPKWITILEWLAGSVNRELPPSRDVAVELPFEELLLPFVLEAWDRLALQVQPSSIAELADSAREDLRHGLLSRLASVCVRFLFEDFKIFRHLKRRGFRTYSLPLFSPTSRLIYEEYVSTWKGGRSLQFFKDFPVAGRIIATVVQHWINSTAELMQRLHEDKFVINTTFSAGTSLGLARSIQTNLSDPHKGGRMVSIITFENGRRIVYKPKDLGVDLAWRTLVMWLKAEGAPYEIKSPQVLPKEAYGWAEYIAPDCQQACDNANYYKHAGALLALIHLLRGSDFHYENIIRQNNYPVPIDLETLLTPRFTSADSGISDDPAIRRATAIVSDSVLATHFLPLTVNSPYGGIEAIGGLDLKSTGNDFQILRNINTDAMEIAKGGQLDARPSPHTELSQHKNNLVEGYAAFFSFLLKQKEKMLDEHGPLKNFRSVRIRILLAHTATYAKALKLANEYKNLTNGTQWSRHFVSATAPAWDEIRGYPRDALRALEIISLSNLDIPYFTIKADETAIEVDGNSSVSIFEVPLYEQMIRRISNLDETDSAFQQWLIKGSLRAGVPSNSNEAGSAVTEFNRRWQSRDDNNDPVKYAEKIGRILRESSIKAGGSATWIGSIPVDHERGTVGVVGQDLYSGSTGISLFLSGLYGVTGNVDHQQLALSALKPVEAILAGGAERKSMGIGGATGFGSILYGLVKICGFHGTQRLEKLAEEFSALIDRPAIEADRSFDVMAGSAGAILALLAHHQTFRHERSLERAVWCGRHLISNIAQDESGNRGWPTIPTSTKFLNGFSHGAAGIALALLRLFDVTRDQSFKLGAQYALDYERQTFSKSDMAWPDFRFPISLKRNRSPGRWCNGAAGIGLARIGCLGIINDTRYVDEINTAAEISLANPELSYHSLCCGSFGELEFLNTVGLALNRSDLLLRVRSTTLGIVSTAASSGGMVWPAGDDRLNPGFFQGISGVGYQLLRQSAPQFMPNILLWE